jgi:hypothetical protein
MRSLSQTNFLKLGLVSFSDESQMREGGKIKQRQFIPDIFYVLIRSAQDPDLPLNYFVYLISKWAFRELAVIQYLQPKIKVILDLYVKHTQKFPSYNIRFISQFQEWEFLQIKELATSDCKRL